MIFYDSIIPIYKTQRLYIKRAGRVTQTKQCKGKVWQVEKIIASPNSTSQYHKVLMRENVSGQTTLEK